MSTSEFIQPDDPKWDAALARCKHDLYHLPAYVTLEAEWNHAEAVAFSHVDGGHVMLLPLLQRPTPAGTGVDAVTPYGYSPPVFSEHAPESFRAHALLAFQQAARDSGMVSTFVRLHPMLCPSLPAPRSGLQWTEVERGFTVTMPMEKEPELWLKTVAKGHRLDVRKLQRAGCRFVLDTDAAWDAFPGIYRATMERIGARTMYFYSDDYLRAFRSRLEGRVHCAAIEDGDGQVLCASLFTLVDGLLQYHLSGTSADAVCRAPTKLLLYEMRQWARERGIRRLHLGGGYGSGRDTLFEFKQRFGGEPLIFRTVSIVHDPDKFGAECDAWIQKSDMPLPGSNGFFPPYRAPVVSG